MRESENRIVISAVGSISALGFEWHEVQSAYQNSASAIVEAEREGCCAFIAPLSSLAEKHIESIRTENRSFASLDRVTLLAIAAARGALRDIDASRLDDCGVSIGTARGATGNLERSYCSFLRDGPQALSPRTSPTTTLGNISSWVAQDSGLGGIAFSHSSTCNGALHAIANAAAWIRSGMSRHFLVGGSEAPLTAFTISQMRALTIYASRSMAGYACRPFGTPPENSFVLGEAACCFFVERLSDAEIAGRRALAEIVAVGLGMEELESMTALAEDAPSLTKSMRNALDKAGKREQVDLLVAHAPGTVQGDSGEYRAIQSVFGDKVPTVVSNKWKVGHTLGASGALSVEYALHMLNGLRPCAFPYRTFFEQDYPSNPRRVMINSAGFGGNAVSIVLAAL